MLFGGSGKLKIETADDLIEALKGAPGDPGCPGNGIENIEKNGNDLIFKLTYGQEIKVPAPKDGQDGKSVNKEEIIKEVLSLIPKPKDGVDGKSIDKDELIRDLIPFLPKPKAINIQEVIDVLIPQLLPLIPKPKDGKDGEPPDINTVIQTLLPLIPKPKDGKSVNKEEVVQEVLSLIPKPKDGKDGKDGVDGKDGKNAQFSKWVKEVDVNVETETDSANLAVFDTENDKFFTIKAFVEAKADTINGWFVGEKAFIINIDRQSVNTFTIIPDQKTHDQFSFEIKLINGKPTLAVKSLETKVTWKAKVEIYDL